jgi:hypothetical protein
MEQGVRNPGLREAMQGGSMLSRRDPAELRAYEVIGKALGEVLAPGEPMLAYADRDLHGNEVDALDYDTRAAADIPDVMGYEPGGSLNETDAFAYDQEAARAEPDVMGYEPGGSRGETDAFAYDGAPHSPDNDVFMAAREAKPADVDFLALTDGRLIRGLLDEGRVAISEAPYSHPEVRVIETTYLAVRLPETICRPQDDGWWCWQVRDDEEPQSAAKRWDRGV